jgi:hypothetical protein
MKPCTLSIQYGLVPIREPVAWFINGHQAADWLAEIANWGVPVAELNRASGADHVMSRAVQRLTKEAQP